MSIEDNKELVRRNYEQVVNTGKVDQIHRFNSQDYVEDH